MSKTFVNMNYGNGDIKSIICWFKEHIWEFVGEESHYDSSVTYHFSCKRCKCHGCG